MSKWIKLKRTIARGFDPTHVDIILGKSYIILEYYLSIKQILSRPIQVFWHAFVSHPFKTYIFVYRYEVCKYLKRNSGL